MRSVGLKILKNKLAEYVRIAAGGEIVLVTDRDRVVAELTPPHEGRSEVVSDALLADAVRNGWVVPRTLPRGFVPPRLPVARTADILRELREDRDAR